MKRFLSIAAVSALFACSDQPTDLELPTMASGTGGSSSTATSSSSSVGGAGGMSPTPVPGLYAEYFDRYLDRVDEGVEAGIDHDWMDGAPSAALGQDHFSARWSGTLTPSHSGPTTVILDSDDGVRLWLDDELVVDDWNGHFVTRNTAEIELTAGVPVSLRLDYFEIDLEASVRLSWESEAFAEELIPEGRFETLDQPSGLVAPKPPYVNPVVPFDCPDPGVVATGPGPHPSEIPYAVVCTGGSFPIRAGRGLMEWTETGAALLPEGKPSWAANGFRNWAPELHRVGDRFIGYFTSVNGSDVLSVGAVASTTGDVLGPYDTSPAPLVEHPDGVIDTNFFEDDDGSRWLTYKIDGNAHGKPTPIYIRRLADDGLAFAPGSSPTQILVNDPNTWEGGVVEAQWMIRRGDTYYLFYSGNVYDHRYRTSVARATNILGPYEKLGPPILTNNERWVGPGHGTVLRVGEEDYFVYHAWSNAGNGTHVSSQGRQILVDRIVWSNGWPSIHDGSPSRSPQAWPGWNP